MAFFAAIVASYVAQVFVLPFVLLILHILLLLILLLRFLLWPATAGRASIGSSGKSGLDACSLKLRCQGIRLPVGMLELLSLGIEGLIIFRPAILCVLGRRLQCTIRSLPSGTASRRSSDFRANSLFLLIALICFATPI